MNSGDSLRKCRDSSAGDMPKVKTLLETGDDGSPRPRATTRRTRVFNQAASLARTDEAFRRDLLAVLRATGKSKRGTVMPAGEHAQILAAFDAGWRWIWRACRGVHLTQVLDS